MRGSERLAQPAPCLLVIFGASGDLTRRLLIPDLYGLFLEGLLPEGLLLFCRIMGMPDRIVKFLLGLPFLRS